MNSLFFNIEILYASIKWVDLIMQEKRILTSQQLHVVQWRSAVNLYWLYIKDASSQTIKGNGWYKFPLWTFHKKYLVFKVCHLHVLLYSYCQLVLRMLRQINSNYNYKATVYVSLKTQLGFAMNPWGCSLPVEITTNLSYDSFYCIFMQSLSRKRV